MKNRAFYDSDKSNLFILLGNNRNPRHVLRLIRVLVHKDFVARYQRSLLGIWWGLVNPSALALVLYLVFNSTYAAKFKNGVAFGPYILCGTLIVAFLAQGVVSTIQVLQASASVFTRLPSPPILFAFSSAITNSVNFGLGLIPLLFWNYVLARSKVTLEIFWLPVLIAFGILWVTGIALIGFVLVVRFGDAINVISLFATLMTFLTPVFYPMDSVSHRAQLLLNLNPLTHFVSFYRFSSIGYGHLTKVDIVSVVLMPFAAVFLGIFLFQTTWKKTACLL